MLVCRVFPVMASVCVRGMCVMRMLLLFCDAAGDEDERENDDDGDEPSEDRAREESGAESKSREHILYSGVVDHISDRAVMRAVRKRVLERAVGDERFVQCSVRPRRRFDKY